MANKFKVGDIVRVKTFEELKKDFNIKHDMFYYETEVVVFEDDGCAFLSDMLIYCGKITKVGMIPYDENNRYCLEGCGMYRFTERMIDKLPSIDEVEPATIEQDVDSITIKIPNFVEKNCLKVYREEEKEMEDIKLLNVYEDRAITHLRELYDEEFENIKNSNEFIAKFKAITDVYNTACEELFKLQHEKQPNVDIYPIRTNNYPNGCNYAVNEEYLDKKETELQEKYGKLKQEFDDKLNECRMQVKLIQQTSNSYEDIMKVLKLYGVVDDNGKVVTYEPTIVEEKKEEEVKPKRKYTKRKQVNEDNRK